MDFTELITRTNGNKEARRAAISAVYDRLLELANAKMSDQPQDHTLTSTALVHEASLRLLDDSEVPVKNRGQFLAYASKAMRSCLIDHARTKGRQKRGGGRHKHSLEDALTASYQQSHDLLSLDDALQVLAKIDPRKAQVVEMRYFGGLTNQEIADALATSRATVKRDWTVAKAWLRCQLTDDWNGGTDGP